MAYSRRKQFEARLIAVEVAKIFAGVTDAPKTASSDVHHASNRVMTRSGRVAEMMPARALLDQMGVRLDF